MSVKILMSNSSIYLCLGKIIKFIIPEIEIIHANSKKLKEGIFPRITPWNLLVVIGDFCTCSFDRTLTLRDDKTMIIDYLLFILEGKIKIDRERINKHEMLISIFDTFLNTQHVECLNILRFSIGIDMYREEENLSLERKVQDILDDKVLLENIFQMSSDISQFVLEIKLKLTVKDFESGNLIDNNNYILITTDKEPKLRDLKFVSKFVNNVKNCHVIIFKKTFDNGKIKYVIISKVQNAHSLAVRFLNELEGTPQISSGYSYHNIDFSSAKRKLLKDF